VGGRPLQDLGADAEETLGGATAAPPNLLEMTSLRYLLRRLNTAFVGKARCAEPGCGRQTVGTSVLCRQHAIDVMAGRLSGPVRPALR
jgi:hypothetical protein